jgi:hypothetical protein
MVRVHHPQLHPFPATLAALHLPARGVHLVCEHRSPPSSRGPCCGPRSCHPAVIDFLPSRPPRIPRAVGPRGCRMAFLGPSYIAQEEEGGRRPSRGWLLPLPYSRESPAGCNSTESTRDERGVAVQPKYFRPKNPLLFILRLSSARVVTLTNERDRAKSAPTPPCISTALACCSAR